MDNYKPLRAGLFSYELIRFTIILKEIRLFSGVSGADAAQTGLFVFLTVPNALFLLITLFLLLNLKTYTAYIPLYTAGKCLTTALSLKAVFTTVTMCGGLSSLFAVLLLGGDMTYYPFTNRAYIIFLFFITIGDIFCVINGIIIHKKVKSIENREEKNNE